MLNTSLTPIVSTIIVSLLLLSFTSYIICAIYININIKIVWVVVVIPHGVECMERLVSKASIVGVSGICSFDLPATL